MVAAHFGVGPVEDEASSFAGALLMPKDDLEQAYRIFRRFDMVAAYFKVTVEAGQGANPWVFEKGKRR